MWLIIIFKKSNYLFLLISATLLTFLILAFSSNLGIINSLLFDTAIPLFPKVNIVGNIPYGYISEFSWQSLVMALFSTLFGINLAGIIYYVRLYKATAVSAITALGSGSIVSAIIGIGCISCGSLVAAIVASLFGASSLAIILPFGGIEFGLISIVLLLISIMLLNQKIKQAYL